MVVEFRWEFVGVICSFSIDFFVNVGIIFLEVDEGVFFVVVLIESNDG